ncbi:Aste57867_23919 [Aphanomyces stellatus]|uniref:Aste57867_23919 protein n=1 Tax=Aphanomyces stellatus TaxID=120398 RepID=A0A485LQU6_9STRA|nr:hypothetical protein As57867_023846 [Aphanomyces stellatus]VFU00562.1 Aste57867_23919 [Aphanomyces stellatus]
MHRPHCQGGVLVEFTDIGNQDIIQVIADPEFSFGQSIANATELTARQRKYLLRCLEPNPTLRAPSVDAILEPLKMQENTTTTQVTLCSSSAEIEKVTFIPSMGYPCAWTIHGPPESDRWKPGNPGWDNVIFQLVLHCEMHCLSQSTNCHVKSLDLPVDIEEKELPILKASYVLLQCLSIAKALYDLSLGGEFEFNLTKLNLPAKCLSVLESRHGPQPSLEITTTLENILSELQPDLDDNGAVSAMDALRSAFAQFRSAPDVATAIQNLNICPLDDTLLVATKLGGLHKHQDQVHWICDRHNQDP